VEVNLQARDLTNLRLAQYLRAHCLLVADIERGGVFAELVGTWPCCGEMRAAPDQGTADQPLPRPPRPV
jgi:cobyric acid synthase